jgi:hypothetical protein
MRIGEFLVERKVLTQADVERILDYGKREGLRFGEAGLRLGLLSEEKLVRVFGKNYRVDFFHLDPAFFPKRSTDILGIDTALRCGVLMLGFKSQYGFFKRGKTLNIGMLDPGRKDALAAAEKEVRTHGHDFKNTKVFLLLADQFLNVVQSAYGLSLDEIASRPSENLDRTLALFLEERA